MTIHRKYISSAVMASEGLGQRQIRVRASSAAMDSDGDVLVPKGCVTRSRSVPVILDHKATIENIVGRAEITVTDGSVDALINFAEGLPPETQVKADDALAKYKGGYATDVSVGFIPVAGDKTKTGYLFTEWDMKELSLVVIGANPEAVVTEKTMDKPLDAEAVAAELRDLAKKAPKGQGGAYRHAANLVTKAAGIVSKDAPKLTRKGLYEVGWLARLLADLGCLEEWVEWEADYEEDGSPVPSMLVDAMRQLGQTLIAMTVEEVSELLKEEAAEDTMEVEMDGKSVSLPVRKALSVKAGRVLSAKNEADLTTARDLIDNVVSQVATEEPETAKAARIREAEALRLLIA